MSAANAKAARGVKTESQENFEVSAQDVKEVRDNIEIPEEVKVLLKTNVKSQNEDNEEVSTNLHQNVKNETMGQPRNSTKFQVQYFSIIINGPFGGLSLNFVYICHWFI